jgi:hypothetical protein
MISPGLFCLSQLRTLSLSSCLLTSLPHDNSLRFSITKTRHPQSSTQLEDDDDMEYEYDDDSQSVPRNYETEFGHQDWSSFPKSVI